MKNSLLRQVARSVLRDRGFDVRVNTGQGYLPGSRVTLAAGGKKTLVAIKASQDRALSFTRQSDDLWRTLHAVKSVIAVVPGEKNRDEVEVLAFEKKTLVRVFDQAWKVLTAKQSIRTNVPVFVPLDAISRKNVGHKVGNLKELASWSARLTAEELAARASDDGQGDYVEEFKRKFAAEHGVDIGQVKIKILGHSK